jgi:type IV pilus assembly protein PilC
MPSYALSLVRIGEETGSLEATFGSLAVYYAKRDELSQSIRSSLIYPLSMMVMVLLVVVVLLTQAMPIFDQVFEQLGFALGGFAGFLLGLGNALSTYAIVIAAVIVAVIAAGLILRATAAGKRFLNNLFQSNPITGDLSLRLSTQRFALALATLLNSGLEVDQALEYAEPLVDDKRAARRIGAIRADIDKGESFPDAIEHSKIFPPTSMSLLAVGFKTGSDAAALDQIGEQITASTERKLEGLVGAIEPVLVGIMCVLVGIILLSVMLPLLGVLTSI